jgi:outer membrane immunogenic protein
LSETVRAVLVRFCELNSNDGDCVMKTILRSTVAAATLLTISLGAQAADLPMRPYQATAPAVVQQVYNWTGIYVGVNGGGAWGNQDPLNIITNRFDNRSIGISGGLFGGTVGAQIQAAHVVLGLEADLDWAGISGSSTITPTVGGTGGLGTFNAKTNIDWESTVRARVGYANNNWLFYATGGVALLGAKTTLTAPAGGALCGGILANCTGTDRQAGLALGAGLEYGITPALSAKLEYLYVSAVSLDVSHTNEIRAGLNYRFGGM